ncbi:MAG: cytochrome P450 [Gemmatimonadetes bacterium]|nr:cytochrome P450 [Gemmatimonadota bacterium]
MSASLYRPPAPHPRGPVTSLARVIARRENNLLSLLPDVAYREMITPLGMSRRGIVLVNAPALVSHVMDGAVDLFPKNDLFVGALESLVGDAMFVSSGERWRQQRRTLEPAFSHMRITRAFPQMVAAVDAHEAALDQRAAEGTRFSLDAAMSHLTADVITRTIFSTPLERGRSREVFDAFDVFERSVESVSIRRLLLDKPWARIPQPAHVLDACTRIRRHVGEQLEARFAAGAESVDDIAGAAIAARDPETGRGFTREELINEIGVFFLAGHETTASALTWTFFILSQQPATVARIRAEVDAAVGDGPVEFDHARKLPFVRNVFREVLRLYPPITFLPRVAAADTTIGDRRVRKGTMVMIAPWSIHRHERLWRNPDRFDPDRFDASRDGEITPGAYLPFGAGPRVCIGAGFATLEASLVIARLVRRYDFVAEDPGSVWPLARLTTRPAHEITVRVTRRAC